MPGVAVAGVKLSACTVPATSVHVPPICGVPPRESVMTKNCVESTLAGSWYDANPVRLKAELEGYLEHAQIDADESIVAVVVPHAGYAYSGLCAAHGVKALAARKNLRRVVVVGFSHRIAFANQASIPLRETCFRSPLGETELDTEALAGWLCQW